MDKTERELRAALDQIAERIALDLVGEGKVGWAEVSKLVRVFVEKMVLAGIEDIPAEAHHQITEDTVSLTMENIREEIIPALHTGIKLLVWRSYVYAIPKQWQRRLSTKAEPMDRALVEKFEEETIRIWRSHWNRIRPGLLRDPRGQQVRWNTDGLMRAIKQAAPDVPSKRWGYDAVAEKITQNEQLEDPLTGDALRMLISRKRLTSFWKRWGKNKAEHKK